MTAKLARVSILCRGAESPQKPRRTPRKRQLVFLCVHGVFCGQSAANQPRAARTKWALVAIGLLFAFVDGASAQTAPVPGISTGGRTGFLSRMAFFLSVAGMQTEDPRFSLAQRGRADLDLFSYRRGRINFLVDTELVMGSERRAFDLNQSNVIFETSSSLRLGPVDLAAVAHHVSRHVVDREFDRVPAWHTVGARAAHVFQIRQSTIDVNLEYGRVVQHTFVDYRWTSQMMVRLEPAPRPGAHVRGRQTGGRVEGGLQFAAERGVLDLFGAYERRVDGYPTSRQPSSWFEFGLRLATP